MDGFIDVTHLMTTPQGRFALERDRLAGIALHHSVSGDSIAPDAGETQEIAHLQAIDRYHIEQGFGGIGYHMAVFASGRIYLTGSLEGARAHVAGRNHELLGLVGIGTFTERLPSQQQAIALRRAVAMLREATGRALSVRGHREWALPGQGTVCPGRLLELPWVTEPAVRMVGSMMRHNAFAASLEGAALPAGAQHSVLDAVRELSLPAGATAVRLEIALASGSLAVGDDSYAGMVDERYAGRLGIIDVSLRPDGTVLYDCSPGTRIDRVGCLGYWL